MKTPCTNQCILETNMEGELVYRTLPRRLIQVSNTIGGTEFYEADIRIYTCSKCETKFFFELNEERLYSGRYLLPQLHEKIRKEVE